MYTTATIVGSFEAGCTLSTGGVLAFILIGRSMDVTSLIGVAMLSGIVVNNGIVMIDAANQLRLEGLDGLRPSPSPPAQGYARFRAQGIRQRCDG